MKGVVKPRPMSIQHCPQDSAVKLDLNLTILNHLQDLPRTIHPSPSSITALLLCPSS